MPSPSTMKSASSYRRGTGFEHKSSRHERRLHTSPVTPTNAQYAHKLGIGKRQAAQKHQSKKQRLSERGRKFANQQVFMETETPATTPAIEQSANEQQQAWEQHLLLLFAERDALRT